MVKDILRDKKNIVILLLLLLILIRLSQAGARFALWAVAGISFSAFFDLLVNRIFLKKTIFPKSAIISGLILAGVLDYREQFLTLFIFALLVIISKHILKFREKHIFNPANFALFAAVVFRYPLTWHIESNTYLIVIIGLYLAYTLGKIPHITGFLVPFSLLFFLGGINPFSLISWFFLFIMLIEPKTSGFGMRRGFIFGAIAGVSSYLFFKFLPRIDLFVGSLFVANLFNPLFESKKGLKK